jgi:hypothetical protein
MKIHDNCNVGKLAERFFQRKGGIRKVLCELTQQVSADYARNKCDKDFAICCLLVMCSDALPFHVALNLVEELFNGIFGAIVGKRIFRRSFHICCENQEKTLAISNIVHFFHINGVVKPAIALMLGNDKVLRQGR